MNGPQDVGGRMGFGPVAPDPGEPLFHHDWEKRALGLTLCGNALGHWSIDEGRHARESLPPAVYYGSSYYAIWLRALKALLEKHGELRPGDLDGGEVAPGIATDKTLKAEAVPGVLSSGSPYDREPETSARFAAGDRVRTRNLQPTGHIRLPAYAREKVGTVEAVIGCHVFPDLKAKGEERGEWLYRVAFDGRALWGPDGDPSLTVTIDAFEPYLDGA